MFAGRRLLPHATPPARNLGKLLLRPFSFLLFFLLLLVFVLRARSGRGVYASRPSVAIFRFQNLSGTSGTAWVSSALTENLQSDLSASEGLRLVPGEVVLRAERELALPPTASLSKASLDRIHRDLDCDLVVVGSYLVRVVNAGIGGDTITSDSSNATGHIQNAVDRLGRDVLAQPNVIAMVSYLGSIDIRSVDCKSAPEIEAATATMVSMAAAAKVRVVLGTIPPSAFCTNPARANYGPTPTAADPYAGGEEGLLNPGETQRMALNA